MKKPHYTDPLKAVWMAREFGVKFKSARGQHLYFDGGFNFRTEKDSGIYAGDKYYIHPDSFHIFEPREWDIIVHENLPGLITSKQAVIPNLSYSLESASAFIKTGHAEIIQRNGKPFFMPEVEE